MSRAIRGTMAFPATTQTIVSTFDGVLAQTFTKTATFDSDLQALGLTKTATFNADLKVTGLTKTATFDAIAAETHMLSASMAAMLINAGKRISSMDGQLQKLGLVKTATHNAVLTPSSFRFASFNALLTGSAFVVSRFDASIKPPFFASLERRMVPQPENRVMQVQAS